MEILIKMRLLVCNVEKLEFSTFLSYYSVKWKMIFDVERIFFLNKISNKRWFAWFKDENIIRWLHKIWYA